MLLMAKFPLLLSVFVIFSAPVFGQEKEQRKEIPPRDLRFLAVGDTPPFRQEIRDGVRYELDAPPGSLPPRKLELQVEGGKAEQCTLILGRPSARVEVPGIELTAILNEGGQRWHGIRVPEGGDYLSVIWRSPETNSWDQAYSLLVPDGESFEAGQARFINVAPVPIRVLMSGGKPFEIAPGKTETVELKPLTANPTRVVYQSRDGRWRRLWSSALNQNRGERSTVVVYQADGEKPRAPLKLLSIREKVNPPKPKEE